MTSQYYSSPVLLVPPNFVSEDNVQRLGEADAGTVWVQSMLYKELVAQYDNRHPSFLVRIAKMYAMSNCPLMAVIIYREVSEILAGTPSLVFDTLRRKVKWGISWVLS